MKYSTKLNQETSAKGYGTGLPVSLKQTVEICRYIRNKSYVRAVKILESTIEKAEPIPYRTFNRGGTGHRKGMGPGRYPVKASMEVLKILKSVHANAKQKGLDVQALMVKGAVAKKAAKTPHYGRQRGRVAKRTHLEIVLGTMEKSK